MGVPLSSQMHDGTWYVKFKFKGKYEVAVFSQIKVFSVSRLYTKMGQIDKADMLRIKTGFHELYCK